MTPVRLCLRISEVSTVASRLQEDLDVYCVKEFQKLCTAEGKGSAFCAGSAVARFGKGLHGGELGWRCYDKSILRSTEKSMQCVDECGNLLKCVGRLEEDTVTSELLPEFASFVHSRKWTYCSSFQQAADAMCNFKKTSYVARYDNLRKRWMCFDPVGSFHPVGQPRKPGEGPRGAHLSARALAVCYFAASGLFFRLISQLRVRASAPITAEDPCSVPGA